MSYRDELDVNEFTRLNTRIAELLKANQELNDAVGEVNIRNEQLEETNRAYKEAWSVNILTDRIVELEATIKAIRELPRCNRYQVMDDTTDDNSSRWILADELEALLPEEQK